MNWFDLRHLKSFLKPSLLFQPFHKLFVFSIWPEFLVDESLIIIRSCLNGLPKLFNFLNIELIFQKFTKKFTKLCFNNVDYFVIYARLLIIHMLLYINILFKISTINNSLWYMHCQLFRRFFNKNKFNQIRFIGRE